MGSSMENLKKEKIENVRYLIECSKRSHQGKTLIKTIRMTYLEIIMTKRNR